MKILPFFFQCLFYTGSWVKKEEYDGLLTEIRKNPFIDRVDIHRPFQTPSNQSILIGHSLGGYFALWDAIRHPQKVAGVILLHSHFNSRGLMPYPSIKSYWVQVPVLTLLAGKDERLPIRKAMDDAWECTQENEMDKYFVLNREFGHFTGITETDPNGTEIQTIMNNINTFVDALGSRNFSSVRILENYRHRFKPEYYDELSTYAYVASQSLNIIDAILRIVGPRCLWKFLHFVWFLTSKPEGMSILFMDDNHIYLKGKQKDKKYYHKVLDEWLRDVPYQIVDDYLPTTHPSILRWLLCSITPRWDGVTMLAPRIILRVDNETVYYKVPNPRKFFAILPEESFFENKNNGLRT